MLATPLRTSQVDSKRRGLPPVGLGLSLMISLLPLHAIAADDANDPVIAKVVATCPAAAALIDGWKKAAPGEVSGLIAAWNAAPKAPTLKFRTRQVIEGSWGDWDITLSRWADPDKPPEVFDSGESSRAGASYGAFEGRVLVERFKMSLSEGHPPKETLDGFSVTGYDSASRQYVSVWTGERKLFQGSNKFKASGVEPLPCQVLRGSRDAAGALTLEGDLATRRLTAKAQTLDLFELRGQAKRKTMTVQSARGVFVAAARSTETAPLPAGAPCMKGDACIGAQACAVPAGGKYGSCPP